MSDLKTALEGATGEGIISADQAARLLPYLAARNIGVSNTVVRNDLSQPREDDLRESAGGQRSAALHPRLS